MENWIWLPAAQYPAQQTTSLSCMLPGDAPYAVCELEKTYDFGGRPIRRVRLRASGDTAFRLYLGDEVEGGAAFGKAYLSAAGGYGAGTVL